MNATYEEFLAGKVVTAPACGFEVSESDLNPALFDWQKRIVRWACRRGRAALFADCGLGKTPMQLSWSEQVYRRLLRPVLILAPLAVAQQTRREGEKFGIPVTVCKTQADVRGGINVANYERLQHFDASAFGGIVLDESSILKNYMGATKQAILTAFRDTPFRLACTATPAPNDHLELGNHAEFLGVMPANEMLMRWFINDTMKAGAYRLKGHAEADFWQWVSTWAVSLSRPSDLGYANDGYELPPLEFFTHIVDVDLSEDTNGQLFRSPDLSSTAIHTEKRRTIGERAAQVADLANETPGNWVVWCDTDYEADELMKRIPEAREVRGSHPLERKEKTLNDFCSGALRILVSKPRICGFGLNFQHCHQQAFVGVNYSFEAMYQAIRRLWRFGQSEAVACHIVCAETELPILESVGRKQSEHERMKDAMTAAMRDTQLDGEVNRLRLQWNTGRYPMELPSWLGKAA